MDPAPNLEQIPRPPGHMLVGNLFDLEAGHPIESLMELARKYGPIFELDLPGGRSLTFEPLAWAEGTTYTVSLSSFGDVRGNPVATRSWTFTTTG